MRTTIALTFAVALSAVACHRSSVHERAPKESVLPPPTPIAPPEWDLRDACAALERLGCPEALPDSRGRPCPEYLAAIRAESTVIPTACVVLAQTRQDVARCGAPNTLRFTCAP